MFEGGYRNRERIMVPSKGHGVVIMPEPVYQYPKNHPCCGCVFTFHINKPSCLTGGHPDTENCINALYKKIQAQHRAESEKRQKESESKNQIEREN